MTGQRNVSQTQRTKKKEMWFDFQQTTFHKTTKGNDVIDSTVH